VAILKKYRLYVIKKVTPTGSGDLDCFQRIQAFIEGVLSLEPTQSIIALYAHREHIVEDLGTLQPDFLSLPKRLEADYLRTSQKVDCLVGDLLTAGKRYATVHTTQAYLMPDESCLQNANWRTFAQWTKSNLTRIDPTDVRRMVFTYPAEIIVHSKRSVGS
jgi:hypothetical protein